MEGEYKRRSGFDEGDDEVTGECIGVFGVGRKAVVGGLKGISGNLMEEEGGEREFWRFLTLRGVVTKTMEWPFCSKSWAKARNGMTWPWAMKGNSIMYSLRFSVAKGEEFERKNNWGRGGTEVEE